VWGTVAFGAFRRCETSLVSRLQTCSFSRPAIGISRKLIAVNSLIEKQCLHGLGGHPFRDLSGSRGFPCFGLPCGSAVVSGFGRSR
jgi:hypothetical protein